MKGELEDGCEDSPAASFLPAVSLGLELPSLELPSLESPSLESNERSAMFQQLRDPDRAAVLRPGRRLGATSVHVGTTGGATGGAR